MEHATQRIAILGAGPSGLCAALALKKKGYEHVTVFEKESRIGGKSYTVEHEGVAYDLGSMTFSKSDPISRVADEFGVRYEPITDTKVYLTNGRYVHPVSYILKRSSPFKLFRAYLALHRLMKETRLLEPGYRSYPEAFSKPFAEFIRGHAIEPLARAVEPVITGFAYGYYEEVPAIYALKFMGSMLETHFVMNWLTGRNTMCYFPEGWTRFWETVAKDFDVRLDANVTRITRDASGVTLEWNGQRETFDLLMIATPLTKLEGFVDLSDEERELFSMIRSYRIASTLVEADIHPHTSFYVDRANRAGIDHAVGFEDYHPDKAAYVAFQIIGRDTSLETAGKILVQDARELGSETKSLLKQKAWDYFYHVPTEGLQKGFYERLDKLQGVNGTYYLGGVMNFESVGHCREFSDSLVQKHF